MAQSEKLSESAAAKIYRKQVFKYNPQMNPSVVFTLSEETTPELWQRLGAQMFRVHGQPNEDNVILIKDGKMTILIGAFGGMGPGSMCIADLNGDGHAQLVYTYEYGSGISYSAVAVVFEHEKELVSCPIITCKFCRLSIKKQDNKTVSVELDNTKVGNIYKNSSGNFAVNVVGLPDELRKKLSDEGF